MLVCTEVAAMGLHTRKLNLSLSVGKRRCFKKIVLTHKGILGLPSSSWKLAQQAGRVGRDGMPAVDITLVYPQKGTILPVIYR